MNLTDAYLDTADLRAIKIIDFELTTDDCILNTNRYGQRPEFYLVDRYFNLCYGDRGHVHLGRIKKMYHNGHSKVSSTLSSMPVRGIIRDLVLSREVLLEYHEEHPHVYFYHEPQENHLLVRLVGVTRVNKWAFDETYSIY